MENNSFLSDYFKKRRSLILRSFLISLFTILLISILFLSKSNNSFIAKLSIDGVIYERKDILKTFDDLFENEKAKGILITVNSPGGTFVSSKEIFDSIMNISNKIPTAVYMKEMATSGGYLVSLGADKIFSNYGTITGSIGVVLQTADLSKLLDKLGINPIVVKSGNLKSVPNPFEEASEQQIEFISEVISQMQDEFINIVKDRRKSSYDVLNLISDGRILTGRQAKELDLIDEIGTEKDAINWLKEQAGIVTDVPVVDFSDQDNFFKLLNIDSLKNKIKNINLNPLNGILAIWTL